jgi:hypothetical protein
MGILCMVLHLNYLTYIILQIYAYYFYKNTCIFIHFVYKYGTYIREKVHTFGIIKLQIY